MNPLEDGQDGGRNATDHGGDGSESDSSVQTNSDVDEDTVEPDELNAWTLKHETTTKLHVNSTDTFLLKTAVKEVPAVFAKLQSILNIDEGTPLEFKDICGFWLRDLCKLLEKDVLSALRDKGHKGKDQRS